MALLIIILDFGDADATWNLLYFSHLIILTL